MHYEFTSQRLGFRNWLAGDLDALASINADPIAMEFFPAIKSREESKIQLEWFADHFQTYGFTFYATDLLAEKRCIGFIGMVHSPIKASFAPCVEIGWRLDRSIWNQGLATEGAKACLEYGFSHVGLEEIYSFTAVLNKRSERIMQKIGMQKAGEFDHPKVEVGHPLHPHVLYHMAADQS